MRPTTIAACLALALPGAALAQNAQPRPAAPTAAVGKGAELAHTC